jgi:hypothetical protein
MGGVASMKSGNPLAFMQSVRNLYGRTVMPEQVRDRIGSMLMTRGPETQGLLGDLSRYVDEEQARRAAQAARGGLLGGALGSGLLNN